MPALCLVYQMYLSAKSEDTARFWRVGRNLRRIRQSCVMRFVAAAHSWREGGGKSRAPIKSPFGLVGELEARVRIRVVREFYANIFISFRMSF